MKQQYQIRPHHGMCIAFFEGQGYSSAFTVHMGQMIEKLEENPLVCLMEQTDSICLKCPNNQQGNCKTPDKVERYDKQVLEYCGLSENTILPYKEFEKIVYEKVLLSGRREEICGDCEWNEICKNGKLRLLQKE